MTAEQEIAELQKQIAAAEEAKQKALEESKASFASQQTTEAAAPSEPEDECEEHKRKLEIICI